MAGFFGTEQQVILQAAAEAALEWTRRTPGACDPGRFLGTDDPARLGWDTIFETLRRDGAFGFRMIPILDTDEVSRRLTEQAARIDFWDVFMAQRDVAEPAAASIVAAGLPDGFQYLPDLQDAEHDDTKAAQALMAESGIVPFSGSKLVGNNGPAITVRIGDDAGHLTAVAHAYFPHNAPSPFNRSAWGGLVAVSPMHRGRGLGKHVNAKMVSECFSRLDAESIHELAAATNLPSRKMIEAIGLRLDATLKCGIAMASDGARFTK